MKGNDITYQDVLELEYAYRRAKGAIGRIEYETQQGYPSYPMEIRSFMLSLTDSKWGNKAYDPRKTQEFLDNIESADMFACTSIMTSYSRGERFSDGLWKSVLDSDSFDKVFTRMKQLTGSMAP
ncbi:MAG: DUF6508 domain-containing protein [Chloroflexota bacterium]